MGRASNTDWWTGHAGPEKGKRLTWQRVQPGYYRLRGTDIYLANMAGSSVLWTGLTGPAWIVRYERHNQRLVAALRLGESQEEIGRFDTMVEAKTAALARATADDAGPHCPKCGSRAWHLVTGGAEPYWACLDCDHFAYIVEESDG